VNGVAAAVRELLAQLKPKVRLLQILLRGRDPRTQDECLRAMNQHNQRTGGRRPIIIFFIFIGRIASMLLLLGAKVPQGVAHVITVGVAQHNVRVDQRGQRVQEEVRKRLLCPLIALVAVPDTPSSALSRGNG